MNSPFYFLFLTLILYSQLLDSISRFPTFYEILFIYLMLSTLVKYLKCDKAEIAYFMSLHFSVVVLVFRTFK